MKKLKSIGKNKEDLLRNKIGKHTFYLLPNFITTASLFSGFYSIVQAMNGKYELAAIAIFIAIIMDGLDGRIARLTHTESAFGAEYDSLSDMVSFGVAPALIFAVVQHFDLLALMLNWIKMKKNIFLDYQVLRPPHCLSVLYGYLMKMVLAGVRFFSI
ncbi:MAG: CDP-diacylglycerol-serine O-phosphatidyltransferase [Pseudomonadota bacterium]